MIKDKIFVLLFLLPLALSCCSSDKSDSLQSPARKSVSSQGKETAASFQSGETITYAIKSLGVNVGEATLAFEGLQGYKGRDAYLITFRVKAVNFFDEERIYADTKTFYPVAVARDLNIWGKKEKITEEYDQQKGIVRITKHRNNKTTEQIIRKKDAIDNIYCFIYRYRESGLFHIGDSFSIHLPTKDVVIDLTKMATLKIAGKTYEAYYMQSEPAKYKVWFDTGEGKIPLKINGAVGIKDTAMTMTAYREGQK